MGRKISNKVRKNIKELSSIRIKYMMYNNDHDLDEIKNDIKKINNIMEYNNNIPKNLRCTDDINNTIYVISNRFYNLDLENTPDGKCLNTLIRWLY